MLLASPHPGDRLGDPVTKAGDGLLHLLCRGVGIRRQLADLVGHDAEATSLVAGVGGLDRRVQRQQMGLLGDRCDAPDEPGDSIGRVFETGDLLRRPVYDLAECEQKVERLAHGDTALARLLLDRVAELAVLAGLGLDRSSSFAKFNHDGRRLAQRSRLPIRPLRDLRHGQGDFVGGPRHLLGDGGEVGGGGRDLRGRAGDLVGDVSQAAGHRVERGRHRRELLWHGVIADLHSQLARPQLMRCRDELRQWPIDRAGSHQRQPGGEEKRHHQDREHVVGAFLGASLQRPRGALQDPRLALRQRRDQARHLFGQRVRRVGQCAGLGAAADVVKGMCPGELHLELRECRGELLDLLRLGGAQPRQLAVTPSHFLGATRQLGKAPLRLLTAVGQVALTGEDQFQDAALKLRSDFRQLANASHAGVEISRQSLERTDPEKARRQEAKKQDAERDGLSPSNRVDHGRPSTLMSSIRSPTILPTA